MREPGDIPTPPLSGHEPAGTRLRRLLLKPVWLPRFIYESLPLIYICSGLVALAAAVYLPGWTWIVPWAVVFGFATLHLGIGIATLRHKYRRTSQRTGTKNAGSQ